MWGLCGKGLNPVPHSVLTLSILRKRTLKTMYENGQKSGNRQNFLSQNAFCPFED